MEFKTTLMDDIAIERAIKRISHEIVEKNDVLEDLLIIGVKTRGIPLAQRVKANLLEITGLDLPCEELDITLYRDDLTEISEQARLNKDLIKTDVNGKRIILCDDVLFTGRTVRAAIDAIMHHGRPKLIQLAVIIDRGHRELPIRPDFVGKNVPTSLEEVVAVSLKETDGIDQVDLYRK